VGVLGYELSYNKERKLFTERPRVSNALGSNKRNFFRSHVSELSPK
jgi:hypothetical protein